jgi:hypothetical protein
MGYRHHVISPFRSPGVGPSRILSIVHRILIPYPPKHQITRSIWRVRFIRPAPLLHRRQASVLPHASISKCSFELFYFGVLGMTSTSFCWQGARDFWMSNMLRIVQAPNSRIFYRMTWYCAIKRRSRRAHHVRVTRGLPPSS